VEEWPAPGGHDLQSLSVEAQNYNMMGSAAMADKDLDRPIACAWCGRVIHTGSAVAGSYGICITCLGDAFSRPIKSVDALSDSAANLIPFGFIRMDAEGRIIAYNTQESALSGLTRMHVLGKNFFRTVAPCTCVDEFEGTLRTMMATGRPERTQIEFLFKFKRQSTMVRIAMTTDPSSGYATLLIRKSGQEVT
jgi:photoactive yellow protein